MITSVDVTIPSGQSLSNVVASPGGTFVGMQLRAAAWTAGDLTLRAGMDVAFAGSLLAGGNNSAFAVQIPSAAVFPNRFQSVSAPSLSTGFSQNDSWFSNFTHYQVRSGTDSAPVAQGADRVVTLFFLN